VSNVQDDIGLGHDRTSYSAGWGGGEVASGLAGGLLLGETRAVMRRTPSITPPGRNTTIRTNTNPSVRNQPSPTNLPLTTTAAWSSPSGRKSQNRARMESLMAEKIFSKYLISQAPITGPTRVPAPPSMALASPSLMSEMIKALIV